MFFITARRALEEKLSALQKETERLEAREKSLHETVERLVRIVKEREDELQEAKDEAGKNLRRAVIAEEEAEAARSYLKKLEADTLHPPDPEEEERLEKQKEAWRALLNYTGKETKA